MTDKKLYQQKKQAQLDEWKAEIDKLKARASGASADAQIELSQQVERLEKKVDAGKDKLAELETASEGAFESVKQGVESAWDSMRSAFSDAADKLKK